jgi:glycine/D-amino acid oxidase-like deaminating enzyme
VLQTGRLDVLKFLESAKSHFANKNIKYIEEAFNYNELKQSNSDWNYKHIQASKVIFAEGIGVFNNPFFQYLPFNPSGGDIVLVEIKNIPQTHILKKKEWLIPIGNDQWIGGSTYHSNDLSVNPEQKDAEWLIQEFESWVGQPVKLLSHVKGIRPTVAERRPYLGQHPSICNLFVYNGLGSKGSSLSSILSRQYALHLTQQLKLDAELDINQLNYLVSK